MNLSLYLIYWVALKSKYDSLDSWLQENMHRSFCSDSIYKAMSIISRYTNKDE